MVTLSRLSVLLTVHLAPAGRAAMVTDVMLDMVVELLMSAMPLTHVNELEVRLARETVIYSVVHGLMLSGMTNDLSQRTPLFLPSLVLMALSSMAPWHRSNESMVLSDVRPNPIRIPSADGALLPSP